LVNFSYSNKAYQCFTFKIYLHFTYSKLRTVPTLILNHFFSDVPSATELSPTEIKSLEHSEEPPIQAPPEHETFEDSSSDQPDKEVENLHSPHLPKENPDSQKTLPQSSFQSDEPFEPPPVDEDHNSSYSEQEPKHEVETPQNEELNDTHLNESEQQVDLKL